MSYGWQKIINLNGGQTLAVDENGIFFGSKEKKFRFKYRVIKKVIIDGELEEVYSDPRWSGPTSSSPSIFISSFKKKGIDISIFDKKEVIDKE